MVLFFNLDNTLVDRRSAFRRWAEAWRLANGLDPGATDWLVAADRGGYRSRTELFVSVAEPFGISDPATLVEEYRRDFFTFIKPEPSVREALGALRAKGWPIGIITNGGTTQHDKIESAQLSGLADGVFVSAELGVRKPDARIFELAADSIGRPLRPGWMIGDNPEADIRGGLQVGLWTVWNLSRLRLAAD